MVYSNKFVVCVKVDGQILREKDGVVALPFGSEYSILLKNLHAVRAMAKVSVDGKDATEETELVLQPNSSIDLERFIRNGNFNKGNRFKFIKRTEQIEKHRGIGSDDGLIRVEFKIEKTPPIEKHVTTITHHRDVYDWYWNDWRPYFRPYWHEPYYTLNEIRCADVTSATAGSGFLRSAQCSSGKGYVVGEKGPESSVPSSSSFSVQNCSLGNVTETSASSDPGITVPGSESHQQFHTAAWFPTEDVAEVIVLHLRGQVGSKKVAKAVTVKNKPQCPTCGKANRGTSSFCDNCGTALQII
jgi:hypothetical protein